MDPTPLVSAIVPAYNAAAHVRAALASAQAQTYPNLEIVVVDDGSTDGTARIVAEVAERDARVRLFCQHNRGVAAARNRAIEASSGAFIAPLDADDVWFPEKIARQVARMQASGPEAGLVYAWSVSIDEEGASIGVARRVALEGRVHQALLSVNFLGNASVPLLRRSCVEAVGGYDSGLRGRGGEGCEDWDLALRIAERWEVRVAPAFLVGYRRVPGSMSRDFASMARSHALVVADVRRRHPEIPDALYRWSEGGFYLWLATVSYGAGNYRGVLRWAREAVRADPPTALVPGLVRITAWSALQVLAGTEASAAPPAPPGGSGEGRGDRFEKDRRRKSQERQVRRAASANEGGALPWRSSYRPYDLICRRRWARATADARTAETDSPACLPRFAGAPVLS